MKKSIVGGAAALVVAIGMIAAPASAGILVLGNMVVTPDPVEQGGTALIGNVDEPGSTCESETAQVVVAVEDAEGDAVFTETVIPDGDGIWSVETTPLDVVGEYLATAVCEFQDVSEELTPAASPTFTYEAVTFEVIGLGPTTTSSSTTSTTVAPTTTTTTTTAATAAVTAAPTYTG